MRQPKAKSDPKTLDAITDGTVTAITVPESDDDAPGFIFMLAQSDLEEATVATRGGSTAVLVDTAAAKSVSPPWFAPQVELKPSKGTKLEQADGTPLRHHGERAVKMHASNSQSIAGKFEVRDIHKPIIAAGDLTDGGSGLWFHRNKSYIITKEKADEIACWSVSYTHLTLPTTPYV